MTVPITRREFVAGCAVACGGSLLAACASLVTHPVPMVAGQVRVAAADFPELAKVNGAVKLQPTGLEQPLVLLNNGTGFEALSPICTHRGCTVEVQGDRLVCPCHGSTYDRGGRVLKGPAERPLERFPVEYNAGVVTITIARA